jgi:4-amino-4-deoxy-L-arabinose transferase-like glycosyltransferase
LQTELEPGLSEVQDGASARPTVAERANVFLEWAGDVVRHPRRHPVTLIIAGALILQMIWQIQDHAAASYDQSSYLSVAFDYVQSVRHGGWTSLPHTLLTRDPGRAPLYPLLIAPLIAVFGPHVDSALVLGWLTLPLLLLCVGDIANRLVGPRARVPAMLMTLTMTLVYGLAREVLVDSLLTSLSALAILCALRSEGLRRRSWSIGLGAALALTTLTKVTAPAFVVVPCALALFVRPRATGTDSEPAVSPRDRLINLGILSAVAIAGLAWWYVPNRAATMTYIRATTSGDLALGAGPDHPFGLRPFSRFLLGAFNQHIGWTVLIVAIVAGALSWRTWTGRFRSIDRRGRAFIAVTMVVLWGFLPTLVVGLGPNQDVRLIAAAVPAIAVFAACALALVPDPRRARAVFLPLIAFSIVGLIMHTVPIRTVDVNLDVTTPEGHASMLLRSSTQGYARLPIRRNHAVDIVMWAAAHADTTHPGTPSVVGLLQTHSEANPNSLSWVAKSLGITNLRFVEVGSQGLDDASFAKQFDELDGIIYIPALAPDSSAKDRATLLNDRLAIVRVSPAQLAEFPDVRLLALSAPDVTAEARWRRGG